MLTHEIKGKRRRTSDESSVRHDTFSEREDASTPPSDLGGPSDEEDDDDDELFLQMTQAIEARKQRGEHVNEIAEYGILEEVEVINFMCHAKWEFKLGPLINFICGKNGSGKSAILTAIILCLGGKASSTNRGARLQNFIKEGTDHATIICRIKNQGENAYMPEKYGSTIQVERHILRNGSSSFKLKSENGRIISTRKSDLEEICDHMMLQIENPMAVLSQDQARQFLAGSSAAEKYKFFMKGVQLEQLDQDYRIIEEQLDNLSAKISTREPDLKALKDKQERAANKLALSDKYEAMHDKVREQRRQLTWAQVTAKEEIRDDYARGIEDADTKIADARTRANELDAVFQASDQAATAAKDLWEAAKAEVGRLKEERSGLKGQYDEAKLACSKANSEQRQIQEQLRGTKKTIAAREEDIRQEEARLAELDGGGAARRLEERDAAQEEVIASQHELREHGEQRRIRIEDVDRAKKLLEDAFDAKKKEDDRVTDLETNIKSLRNNRESQHAAFHQNMKALLRGIQEERGFQERPIGPIGNHVKLLKPEWSSILERVFGKALAGFIVTSKRDENVLSNIMRRTRCDVPIFIANNLPLDIAPHLPDSRFDTILGALDIDNDLVKKQLIIANQIEQCILIPDLQEASAALFNNSSGPLRNVKRCYSFQARDPSLGFMLSYKNQGRAAQDPVKGWVGLPRMKTDVEENIRRQEAALTDRKALRLRAEQELVSARNRHVQAQQALRAHDNQLSNLRIRVQEAQERVDLLEDAIKDDSVENGRLDQLRILLQDAKNENTVHENSYQDSVIDRDDKKQLLDQARDKCSEMDNQISRAEAGVEKAKVAAQTADKKRSRDLGDKNNAFAHIEDAQADRATLERRMREVEEEVVNYTEQARQVCERVNLPEGETAESLGRKFEKLKAELKRWSQQVGDRQELAADASKWSKAFKTAESEIKGLKSLQKQLTKTLANRKYRWAQFRMHITARSRAEFILKLGERGFRGKLLISHKKKEMDIAVEPDITRRDGTGRSAKTLSGGEKSFAQICLLLAIWDAMGVPVRCLDEFDVFMDAVNRNTSVKLLIDGARHSTSGQFIMISPGAKSDIPKANDVNTVE